MATGDSFYEDEYLLSLLRQGSQDAFTQIYNGEESCSEYDS